MSLFGLIIMKYSTFSFGAKYHPDRSSEAVLAARFLRSSESVLPPVCVELKAISAS